MWNDGLLLYVQKKDSKLIERASFKMGSKPITIFGKSLKTDYFENGRI